MAGAVLMYVSDKMNDLVKSRCHLLTKSRSFLQTTAAELVRRSPCGRVVALVLAPTRPRPSIYSHLLINSFPDPVIWHLGGCLANWAVQLVEVISDVGH